MKYLSILSEDFALKGDVSTRSEKRGSEKCLERVGVGSE